VSTPRGKTTRRPPSALLCPCAPPLPCWRTAPRVRRRRLFRAGAPHVPTRRPTTPARDAPAPTQGVADRSSIVLPASPDFTAPSAAAAAFISNLRYVTPLLQKKQANHQLRGGRKPTMPLPLGNGTKAFTPLHQSLTTLPPRVDHSWSRM
jgi:hypothetical protein